MSRTAQIAARVSEKRTLELETMPWGARRLCPQVFEIEGRPRCKVKRSGVDGKWAGFIWDPKGSAGGPGDVLATTWVDTPNEAADLLGEAWESTRPPKEDTQGDLFG